MTYDPNTPPSLPTQPPLPPPPVIDYLRPTRPCPGCGSGPIEEPSFTWWGGLVGHKILNVEQCRACKKWWVKSTGQPGDTRVTVYMVTGIVLGVVIAVVWMMMTL